jgi:hypothetical protein
MWELSCPDWERRMRAGRSLILDLALNETEATDELLLPGGIAGEAPRLGDAAGEWFREIIRLAFGSWDPVLSVLSIRDIFLLAPKSQSKTTMPLVSSSPL